MSSLGKQPLEHAVDLFAAGWRAPQPHAWDRLMADDVELEQPLLRNGRGIALWHDEVRRLLQLLPDLEGEVLDWAGRGDSLFIRLRLTASAAGKPVVFEAVDHLMLSEDGLVTRRISSFDPLPMSLLLLRRPRIWLRWWRSGVGPWTGRRRFVTIRGAR